MTNLSLAALTELIDNGISKKIITQITENSRESYTLTPFGERQLEFMNSTIMQGWKIITNAVEKKDVDTFVSMVKEHEESIKYLRYARIISPEDADFVINTYKDILKSSQKKKGNAEIYKTQTDAKIKQSNALREQQWKFDDQNYEITREYNEYVDTNYYDSNQQ